MNFSILLITILTLSSCNSDLTVMGAAAMHQESGTQTSEIFALSQLTAGPGETIQVAGRRLRPGIQVEIGGKSVILKVESESSASFVMPDSSDGANIGALFKDKRSEKIGYLALMNSGSNIKIPVMDSDSSLVCSDITYQDPQGVLKVGTRNCSSDIPLCSRDGESTCVVTKDFHAINIETLANQKSKIRKDVIIAGVSGTLDDCTNDGDSGCVTVGPTFRAALTIGATDKIVIGQVVGGVVGSVAPTAHCLADGDTNCVVLSPTFKAAQVSGAASKILLGETVGGVGGNVALPATSKVFAGTPYGVSGSSFIGTMTLPAASNVKTGSGLYGDPGLPLTPAYSPDFPSVANVRSNDTVDGITGTLLTCSGGNQSSCVATAVYATMDLSSASVMTDITAANFNSTLATSANFEFWDSTGTRQQASGTSQLQVANVKSGTTLFGVTGQYPSASYPLPSASGVADLNAATFNAKAKSATAFEYWDSAGAYQTGTGDADIDVMTVAVGTNIFGTDGQVPTPICTAATKVSCIANNACNWSGTACSIDAWNIRAGTTIAGVSGSLKTNCRNGVISANFNWDGAIASLPNTMNTTGTAFDLWDTWSDTGGFASNKVTSWSSDTFCDSSTWADVTTVDGGATLSTCAANSSVCQYKDKISGLAVSKTGGGGWNTAINNCQNSTYGGYAAGTWRLPTQKELMSLYTNGIVSVAQANFISLATMNAYMLSATTLDTWNAMSMQLKSGYFANATKTGGYTYLCVR